MIYTIFAFLTGGLTIVSIIINSKLAMRIGVLQGILINYLVGLLFSVLVLLANFSSMNFSSEILAHIPFWAYLGGAIGIIGIAINNAVVPKIGAIYATLLIFIGQLFMGITIDFFIGNSISQGKIIGGLLILCGMVYNSYIDKKQFADLSINEQIS
ncbi:DMT family transporter [Wukongibacter baidiensis]|uniref:DMT family transporter n=1 Tax=Wukongibacter baidiensis TaxID=1723361 RepID=UPI003D7FC2D1